MARVFRKDVLECVRCHGRMRMVAALVEADVIAQVLRCLGLPTEPPVAAKARPPPQAELAFKDPTWDP